MLRATTRRRRVEASRMIHPAPASHPLLWPLVPVYRLGLALRELQLRSGLKPVRRLHWPVVSIGNLSTGGSGKTPLTIALARAFTARGLYVDVLSRGYGRRSKGAARADASGSVDDFGDEPLVIAREAGVPVYVAAERYEAGWMAEKAGQQAGIHLLDDGFQHRQLYRDVDILLLSSTDLNDHLLPAGNLRERLHAAARAHVMAVPADEANLVEAEIRSRGWGAEIWRLRRIVEIPRIDGPVVAFCGIARPDQFFDGLEHSGVKLAARFAFPDHHRYSESDLSRIAAAAQRAGVRVLLTTEKDRVRLGSLADNLFAQVQLKPVSLRIEIENESSVMNDLVARLLGMG